MAIFIALSGTAVATGVATKDGAHSAAKKGKRGPVGPPGPPGAQGLPGAPGLDGSPDTGAQIVTKLAPVDGSGSGLDSDSLDGLSSTAFAPTGTEPWHELGPAVGSQCTADGNFCGLGATEHWHNLSPGSFSTGAYLRDPSGIVHLKGVVQRTAVAGLPFVFHLPLGYRPGLAQVFATTSNNAFGSIYIGDVPATPGAVRVAAGDPSAWISMDGISFRCAPSGSNGCP